MPTRSAAGRASRSTRSVVATPSKLHAAHGRRRRSSAACMSFARSPSCSIPRTASAWRRWPRRKRSSTRSATTTASSAPSRRRRASCSSGALGTLHHVRAEAYGPVVLRPKGSTWRSRKGRGRRRAVRLRLPCASTWSTSSSARLRPSSGIVRSTASSRSDVDDEIYCTLQFRQGATRPARRQLERRELSQDVDRRSSSGAPTAASMPTARSARSTCASAHAGRQAAATGGPSATRPI